MGDGGCYFTIGHFIEASSVSWKGMEAIWYWTGNLFFNATQITETVALNAVVLGRDTSQVHVVFLSASTNERCHRGARRKPREVDYDRFIN